MYLGILKMGRYIFLPSIVYAIYIHKNLSKLKSEINTSEYHQALLTFLAIWFDRIAVANTSLGRWHISGEKLEHPFSRQAIAMVFDYPESNPFCNSSGSALNQLEWIIRYIESESNSPFAALLANASSGEKDNSLPRH